MLSRRVRQWLLFPIPSAALGILPLSSLPLFSPVIGVTGSNGKTTTKEMLARILTQTGPGLKTEGNLNNLIGLPLTLLRLTGRSAGRWWSSA